MSVPAAVQRLSPEAVARLSTLSQRQRCGAMLAVAVGTGYTMLRCRLLPQWVMRGWFLLSATALIMPSSVLLYIIDPLRYLGIPRRWVQTLGVLIMGYTFKAVWWTNPQIRMKLEFDANVDGRPTSWADIQQHGVALTMNHTSFWDVFEMIGLTPMSHLKNMRTLMKASLRKIPIFGGVFDRVGHFAVHFKSDSAGSFHVDKEKQAVVARHVDWHLRKGGSIIVFPEGAVNKHPETLQAFRFGTFATIFQHRLPVYYMVSVGNEKTWPPQDPYGGIPADIRVRIGIYPIDFDKEDSKEVAQRLQEKMQQVRDEMVGAANATEAAAEPVAAAKEPAAEVIPALNPL